MSIQIIFFIGVVVFGVFFTGVLLIPNESKKASNDEIETDTMDYDGAGNFGRIPNKDSKK
ncbi:hypothetical protein OAJ91_03795 [Flavobacteriaceae bacterium]|jgi:cbb3-type cytochrome oxidase subunit 3|nr:hypothetical protein [Flavobacteriaceae bacterium]MDC0210834.1 hypothetical protein [Flavobacteriaceae bacterium]RCL65877.1 MAG: hypothetical protein DBW79_04850 [Cryomorphaceae bacterium]|tara:strand:+ start:190 stop:369 length:180 start_codon:yes stop_codon:yes gene_type:complete